jgi:hypothetical protein
VLKPRVGEAVSKPIWPAIVLGGVGAAGLAVGIAGFVVSVQSSSDADDLADEVRAAGSNCNATSATCADIVSALEDKQTFQGVGIAGLVVGAASLTGMAIYLAVPQSAEGGPKPSALRLTPLLGPTSGVFIEGNF